MRAFPEVLNAGLLDENDTAFIAFDLELLGKRLDALRSAFPMGFHHAIAMRRFQSIRYYITIGIECQVF